MQTANVLIVTDDSEFARVLSARWRAERRPPSLTIVNCQLWTSHASQIPDVPGLIVIGPVVDTSPSVFSSLPAGSTSILCSHSDLRPASRRSGDARILYISMREDWPQTLILVADESLRCAAALRQLRHALAQAAQNERDATLGRYMLEMKHSVNNALTSILGNAELLLLEPGQLNSQSLQQIKTVHHMSLRLHEIMQRFSSLASEIRDAEIASQPETQETSQQSLTHR